MSEFTSEDASYLGQVNTSVLRGRCQSSYWYFVREFWEETGAGTMVENWHMKLMADELQEMAERVFKGQPKSHDTIWNISPGTSKSMLASILFPSWIWTRMPEARILTSSHADTLAMFLSSKSRQVIKSDKYRALFPELELRTDQDSKTFYANTKGGYRLTCTVGGNSPIGFHGSFLICDDTLDTKGAVSEAELKTAADFFDAVLPSRKVDKAIAVTFLIMQRLHVNDPTGHLLEKAKREGAAKIKHYCLPAELVKGRDGGFSDENVMPPELAERYVDGLMDPIRLSREVLDEKKTDGAYVYSGQYLQFPYVAGGGMFKEVYFNRRVKAAPYHAVRVRFWDMAATQGGGCNTAGVLMARDAEGNFYVEDVVAGQWEPNERNQKIKAVALRDRARYGPRNEPSIWVEEEGGASGKEAFQLGISRVLEGFPIRLHNVSRLGSKEKRADPWSCQLAAGNVYIVASDWDVQGYVQEHVEFPTGRKLDRVDASSGAFARLLGQKQLGKGFRVLRVGASKKGQLRIVVCTEQELPGLQIEDRSILILFRDPVIEESSVDECIVLNGETEERRNALVELPAGGQGNGRYDSVLPSVNVLDAANGDSSLPPHHLTKLLDSVIVQCIDQQSDELQEVWDTPIQPWGKLPSELLMSPQDGKRIWSSILRKRPDPPLILVFCGQGDGDRRAISVAYGVADTLHLGREIIMYREGVTEQKGTEPPNRHVFDCVKASRNMVM